MWCRRRDGVLFLPFPSVSCFRCFRAFASILVSGNGMCASKEKAVTSAKNSGKVWFGRRTSGDPADVPRSLSDHDVVVELGRTAAGGHQSGPVPPALAAGERPPAGGAGGG